MKHWALRQDRLSQLMAMVLPLVAFAAACQPLAANAPDAEAAAESATPAAPNPSPEDLAAQAAQPPAKAWLALIDSGQYAESWEAAANVFKSSTSKEQWQDSVLGARAPLGEVSSRQLRATEYKDGLPNAPEGKYVVVFYDSAFAKKVSAREIVTLRQAADESWKVAGYFVE